MKRCLKIIACPLLGIPVATYCLDKLYRRNIYKRKCLFMSKKEFSKLTKDKKEGNYLHKHFDPNTKAKKRIVVVGGGIIGVTQAYILKQRCGEDVDIILIDKGKGIATDGASYKNGGIHHVAIETWTNMKLFKNVLKSLYSKHTNVVLSWRGIFY